jgi:hypothetical protein
VDESIRIILEYKVRNIFCLSFILITLLALLTGCTQDIPTINCADPDVSSCYVKHATESVGIIRDNINIWSRILLIGQILVFIFGLLSTIMIALQGDKNKYWTRPIGLISTALVTGLTSALVSFHVTANIDKLIDIYSGITSSTNTLAINLSSMYAEGDPNEIQSKFKSDKNYQAEYWKIVGQYVSSFNKNRVDSLKIYGSAGQVNSIRAPQEEK